MHASLSRRDRGLATFFVLSLCLLGAATMWLDDTSASQGDVEAPSFEVDPFWPKPLPNHWVIGSAVGVAVDSRDHVFIIHRQQSLNPATEISAGTDPPSAPDCCVAAPPVLEFDPDGNLVGHWGGPGDGYEWPESNHGITVDPKDNVWIGGNGASDSHILKFTRSGDFVKQFGVQGARRAEDSTADQPRWVGGSHDRESFGRVAKISFDAVGAEAFVSDGYLNKRVAVLDATRESSSATGAPTATSPTTAISGATVPTTHRRSSSATRSTAPSLPRTV